jgi:hypothetical protein
MAKRPSNLTLVKPNKKGRKCLPPQNVTVAYLAYNLRDEGIFKSALDAINAGEMSSRFTLAPVAFPLPCPSTHAGLALGACALVGAHSAD